MPLSYIYTPLMLPALPCGDEKSAQSRAKTLQLLSQTALLRERALLSYSAMRRTTEACRGPRPGATAAACVCVRSGMERMPT